MKRRVLGGTKANNNFGSRERENIRQRLWICQSRDSGFTERSQVRPCAPPPGLLVDFQSHDPARAVQFQRSFALQDRVAIHAGDGDKDLFLNQRGGVGAVEIFQRSAAPAGLRQAESQIREFACFRDGNGYVHGVAAFNIAFVIRGIKRGLERDVEVEALFLRVVNATRDS